MLLMEIQQIHEMVGSTTVVIDGKEQNITKTLVAKYMSAKTKSLDLILANYRKRKGIVVKTKGKTETKKRIAKK